MTTINNSNFSKREYCTNKQIHQGKLSLKSSLKKAKSYSGLALIYAKEHCNVYIHAYNDNILGSQYYLLKYSNHIYTIPQSFLIC